MYPTPLRKENMFTGLSSIERFPLRAQGRINKRGAEGGAEGCVEREDGGVGYDFRGLKSCETSDSKI